MHTAIKAINEQIAWAKRKKREQDMFNGRCFFPGFTVQKMVRIDCNSLVENVDSFNSQMPFVNVSILKDINCYKFDR